MKYLKKLRFLIFLLAAFVLFDGLLAHFCPPMLLDGRYYLNDYEVTRRDHPEKVWDKVFFGNSSVIAAYREDLDDSGYINLGLDYGVVRDLWEMVDRGIIKVGSEIVLGLNYLTLYDDFETNPTYPFNRGLLEPYSYFQRDKLYILAESSLKSVIGMSVERPFEGQEKSYYYGSLSNAEIEEKLDHYRETYWSLPLSDFSENLTALEKLAAYCSERGVRLRAVWMPWNPTVEAPELVGRVREAADAVLQRYDAEILDLSDRFDAACFYDLGHLNYEYGAYRFMEVIEPWLKS